MSKEDTFTVEGKVIESHPNGTFRVLLDNGSHILAHLSGKMRQRYIKVLPGDIVTVELGAYDLTKGRITFRKK